MMASSFSSFFGIEPLDGGGEGETCRHAMDACYLCGKRLADDCDIFMYRGDTPFCSEDCRYHQMVRDDFGAGEKSTRFRSPPTRKEEQQRQRRRHEAPAAAAAAAEPARVPLAANVPVAI